MPDAQRYYIDEDRDNRPFLVPVEKEDEWNDWVELEEDDDTSHDVPNYAIFMGGGHLTFADPRVEAHDWSMSVR